MFRAKNRLYNSGIQTTMAEYTPDGITERKQRPGRAQTIWISIEFISVQIADAIGRDLSIMRRELHLFLGTTLFLLGLLNWSIGKYCDGNTADYLSCTRPEAYYYYGGVEIALMVLGALLVLVWLVKTRSK